MSKKDTNQYLKRLKRDGFSVEQGGKHLRIEHANWPGQRVTASSTPSDHRGLQNLKAQVRREFRPYDDRK